ncbi:hypothetical protein P872_21490 [Rhodonellum psychrophilum GCM71 = DSM 17998]|uniref:Uncharacterized protein n=1 Tax=Rhodonellum psychrophilum GCM71 = DSM 17998 TaxID=1123057 RepID=U5BJQ7_9BACT|nr:hypothetical protein P872_21490 [Rhodonellum psychrophilum GCM71 = DSM 17998]
MIWHFATGFHPGPIEFKSFILGITELGMGFFWLIHSLIWANL